MNLTLSVDDRLVERAREAARAIGKSLNELVRELLKTLTNGDAKRDIEELKALSLRSRGRSKGRRFDRQALHER